MSPDVVRPLVTTYLGALIIMATRLDMRWQKLDTGNAEIRAFGNGYYLTSTPIRGLVITVQFLIGPIATREYDLITSEYNDMMTCGILPGCPESLGLNVSFPLIGDDRKVALGTVFQYLRLKYTTIKGFQKDWRDRRLGLWEGHWGRFTINDALVLLCPFLTVPGSKPRAIIFLGWAGTTPCETCFYWEARVVLYDEIMKRTAKSDFKADSWLFFVRDAFASLEPDYPRKFYAGRYAGRPQQKSINLIAKCREVFDQTTNFSDRISKANDEKHTAIEYKELVAAHCEMALAAGLQVRDDTKRAKDPVSKYFAKHKQWPNPNPKTRAFATNSVGAFLCKSMADAAWQFTLFQDKFSAKVRRRVEERSGKCIVSDEELEQTWWTLMLRGLCWQLSITWTTPSEVVPSSYYGNATPIWIS